MDKITTITLKDITFKKEVKLAYFEFLGKRYNIKCTKDIYHELVKLLVEKYSDLITYQDNKLILQKDSFKLELYKKENLPSYTKTRYIFGDWYLITHFPIAQLEKKIREIVSAFDFDEKEIVIGYYSNDEESIKSQEIKPQRQQEDSQEETKEELQEQQEEQMENTNSKIKEVTLKEITFSDDLNFAYFDVYEEGEEYGLQFAVQNVKDIYEYLVKLFVEKHPDYLSMYIDEGEMFLRADFIFDIYKKEEHLEFLDYPEVSRQIVGDLCLYVNYPVSVIEEKIRKVVSEMDLLEDDVIFGYYANADEIEEEARLRVDRWKTSISKAIKQVEEQVEEQVEKQERIIKPIRDPNKIHKIKIVNLKEITFSDDLNFAYFEIWGRFYGKSCEIKNLKDFYQELVKIFIEEYKDSIVYKRNQLILEKDKIIINLYKKEYFSAFALKSGYIRNIFGDWHLYINYPINELEQKIRKIVSIMKIDEEDIDIAYYIEEQESIIDSENKKYSKVSEPQQNYYADETVVSNEEEQNEELEEEPSEELEEQDENFDSSIQTTTLRDITFSKKLKLVYFDIFGKKYNIKNIRDIYQELVKIFVEKYKDFLSVEDNKIILIKIDDFKLELCKKEDLPVYASSKHILNEYYLNTHGDLFSIERKIRKVVSAMGISDDEVIIGYYPNNAINFEARQNTEPTEPKLIRKDIQESQKAQIQQIKLPREIEKPKIFTNFNSNIQTTTLRDITFSRELKLAYFEVFSKKYNIKIERDLYQLLVKIFVEKYSNLLIYEDNKIILDKNIYLCRYDDIDEYDVEKRYRHVFNDWYLYVDKIISVLEERIRKVVNLMDLSEEDVIIGYYPTNAIIDNSTKNIEKQSNYLPVKFESLKVAEFEQPKEDMLLFSSDLKKIKDKFFDYLLNVKNFEDVKAKNFVLAFNFYCYSNNISFSLNNINYFKEQTENEELLPSNNLIKNRTKEVFPVFFDFVQYTKEQKEKELETIKVNCISILRDKFSNGYRVSESAKIDYRKFCNFYKNKFDKELELEREELKEFLSSFTFLYEDTIYLLEFVIDEETKNKLFDFIKKCFAEHKFVYYDTIYNKFSLELGKGIINTCEILKKYLIEINGNEINFKDNYDYISIPNEKIDSDYILKYLENWLFETGRVVKMEEIENNFFNMVSDKIKTDRIKDLIKKSNKIIENSYSKENGFDYFHSDIIYLTNHDLIKIEEIIKNRIQNTNVQFISDEEFFKLLRNDDEFSERYNFVSDLGLKRYFKSKLENVLRFRNQKVELRSSYVSYEDIIETFVDNKKKFDLEDVKNLMQELSYSFNQIYQKISEYATRIGKNDYISNENIDFVENRDKIDNLISEFCGNKKYVFVKDITVFAGFPNVGYAWNKFLLESYVNRYSRRYKLLNKLFFVKNVYGVIVDKKSNLTLDHCLADVLMDSSLTFSSEEDAVKYLIENDYLYKKQNISEVMSKLRER